LTPILFGDSKAPLFGALHEPLESKARSHGVLLCPPIAQEYVRTHWAMRQLALSLTRAGFHCMRFDWCGVGDSAGELRDASLTRWQADAALAAQELRDGSGVRRLSIIGLRFGGAVAALAARDITPAKVVLWDPVLDGHAYVEELAALHAAVVATPNRYWIARSPTARTRAPTELVGFDFGASLLREIESVKIDVFDALEARICLLDSSRSPELAALEKRLRARNVDVELHATTMTAKWDCPREIEELLLPADAVTHATTFLEERA
jgi:alpha/beta superfamily hydrolase